MSTIVFGAEVMHQKIVQIVNTCINSDTISTSEIPADNTIPQSSEGFEWSTVTITPQASANSLFVTFDVFAETSGGEPWAAALFRDSGSNASVAVATGCQNDSMAQIRLEYDCDALTTGAVTLKVRIGLLGDFSGASTIYVNRNSAGSLFGTAKGSDLRVVEFENA